MFASQNGDFRKISRIAKRLENGWKRQQRNALLEIGKIAHDESRRIAHEPKRGRTSIIKVRGRTISHTASAPGEGFASITGKLLSTLRAVVPTHNIFRFYYSGKASYDMDVEIKKNRPTMKLSFQKAIKASRGIIKKHLHINNFK